MPASKPEERVLIIAPIGHDATAMADLLKAHGFLAQICKTPTECSQRIVEG